MPLPMQNPRIAAGLTNDADVQGKLPLSLDEIVVPVMRVGGDFPELAWDGVATGYAWGGAGVPPGAGFFAEVDLVNPAGSGALAHVTAISTVLEHAAGARANIGYIVTDTEGTGTAVNREQATDMRRNVRAIVDSLIDVRTRANAGLLANPQYVTRQEGFLHLPVNIVLLPNTHLRVQVRTADLPMTASFQWIERPARTAEQAIIASR